MDDMYLSNKSFEEKTKINGMLVHSVSRGAKVRGHVAEAEVAEDVAKETKRKKDRNAVRASEKESKRARRAGNVTRASGNS